MNVQQQSEIAVNSNVRLNSGGPDMRVTDIHTQVTVEWDSETGRKTASFTATCLETI